MALVNFKNSPSEETPLTGGAGGNLNIMQENGTTHGTDTKLGYSQSFLNDKIVNIGTSVGSSYRTNILHSKNLIPISPSDMILNKYISNDGSIATSGSGNYYGSETYIDFKQYAGKTITLSEGLELAYYNSNKTFISLLNRNAPRTQTIPSNCSYIRIDCWKDNLNTIQINLGSEALPYESYVVPSIVVDNEEIYSKPVVLWQNSSPTSNFAGQQITLSDSLANYKYYEVIFFNGTSNSQTYSTGKLKNDKLTTLYYLSGLESGGNAMIRYRDITARTDTTLTFGTPYYKQLGQTGITEGANQTVPYQVIGYK